MPFNRRAWHAGVSCFEGRERCNDFSIGIELEGTDSQMFEPEQYRKLAEINALLMDEYPITPQRVTGHSDIAPGRKTDPGPMFFWDEYRQILSRYIKINKKLGVKKHDSVFVVTGISVGAFV